MTSEQKSDKTPVDQMTFEDCYSELQELVEQFERGQMKLADSVERFERGMMLLKRCNQQLNEAEMRVDKLLRRIEPDAAALPQDNPALTASPDEND